MLFTSWGVTYPLPSTNACAFDAIIETGTCMGDTTGYNRPLAARPRGKVSSGGPGTSAPVLPHLTVAECVHYTLTCDPDVALLGMSFPNEQDAAFAAARRFKPLNAAHMESIRKRAVQAMEGKEFENFTISVTRIAPPLIEADVRVSAEKVEPEELEPQEDDL